MSHWRTFLDSGAAVGRYLPWREVARATGLSRTTAWRLQKRDDFPAPYAISPGRVGYREDEVDAWRASRDHSPARARNLAQHRAVAEPAPQPRRLSTPRPAAQPSEAPADTRACRLSTTQPASAPAEAPLASSPALPTSGSASSATGRRGPRRHRSQHAQAIAQQMLLDF